MTRSSILMHVRANPLIGTGRLLRSLTLARQWHHEGGRVVFVTQQLPGVMLRQVAMAGCEARSISLQPGDSRFARELNQLARSEKCSWIVMDDSHRELVQEVAQRRSPDQQLLVLGKEMPEADFCTAGHPTWALVRRNLNSGAPVRLANRRQPKRCLLELSRLGSEDAARFIRMICRRFAGTGIVFDVVTPFASSAADQLYRQNAAIREYMFWHRNADRTFNALFAFHLAIMVDECSFYETAATRIASVLLSDGKAANSFPANLTSHPWLIDRRQEDWVDTAGDTIEKLFDSPTGIARHGAEMVRLVDDQAALRLCQVLRGQQEIVSRNRSA